MKIIYGVALLALSYLIGQWLGEFFGNLLGINANVGGVGFAMIILMLLKEWFVKNNWMSPDIDLGIDFWNKMYIPVVIAMAASLNVKSAVSTGTLAVVAGAIPVLAAFFVFPLILKKFHKI
ncbi:malonate transporter subunit MadL [Aquiflexum gelatinilyticum]|uniref:malonate transporter subunit MadL n=1 Tax=Aquiflexum gelatinilyticum TaxID=2961943 RepID=UPI002166F3EF|nr:malonate transporter subunit MadL [Aquiflexum gelatinilyticum]MCS4434264.1 malonate transporter subunit MadL [Aquiflexum gelatinilyticum]